jgi:hypothetical protein
LIRLRHLQLHALAVDAACFCAFDAAGSCVFSFDPPSLESLLRALAALFRICAHRLGWISSAIYAVFSALVALRFRQLHSPTISLDVFAWWHWASPSTSPVACIHCQCLRHAAAQLHFVSFIFDNLRHSSYPSHSVSLLRSDLPSTCSPSFVFSALRLPSISSANNAAACALVSPLISWAAFPHLRCLWHCFASFKPSRLQVLSLSISTSSSFYILRIPQL